MPILTAEQKSMGGKAAAQQRRADRDELAKLREWFRNLEVAKPQPETPQQTEAYITARLMRVRKQLDRLDKMILTEDDPQKLDRLISATSRLEEQERKLSGRFAPGTTKPTQSKQTQRRTWSEPTPVEPQPAPTPPMASGNQDAPTGQ